MKVTTDTSVCIGAGMCALTAPAVFDQSEEDGTVVLLDETPPPELHAAVRQAERLCPSGAITVLGPDGGGTGTTGGPGPGGAAGAAGPHP
ncbi:hypothetical protein GCM10010517_02310 [Streptosporangium fragile]|uniref:Ferredoxin n=1 Tax=Streptosporangium fragile TaxID=46186 RepID=A0ABP6I582_9ACTN